MNFNNTNQNQNRTGDKQMTFTNTDCVSYDIYWDYDIEIYDQLDEEVDDELRLDLIEQVESQVESQVKSQVHNPIKNKITQEIKNNILPHSLHSIFLLSQNNRIIDMNFTNTDCVKKEVYLDLDMLMNSNLHRKTASRPTYKYLLYHQPKRYVVYDQIKPIRTKIIKEINK